MKLHFGIVILVFGFTSAKFIETDLYNTCNITNHVLCYGLENRGDCINDKACPALVAIFQDDFAKKEDKMRVLLFGHPWDENSNEKLGGYVAMGISLDNQMGEDMVVECVHTEGKGNHIYGSYNEETKGVVTRLDDQSHIIKNWIDSSKNGIYCDFYIDMKTKIKNHHWDLTVKKNEYHILLAMGPVKSKAEDGSNDGTQIGYHKFKKIASNSPILARESIHYYKYASGNGGESHCNHKMMHGLIILVTLLLRVF